MNKYWHAIVPKLSKFLQSAGFAAIAGSILFALGIASDSAPAARAQVASAQAPPVLRVQVDLQTLAVSVTDKQGHDVKDLTADDFTVLEDGHPQKISFFGTDEVPTSLNVLVDESGSMDTIGKLGSAEAIAARFLRSGRPGDEISAMEFTNQMGPFRLLTEQQLRNPSSVILGPGASEGSAPFDAIATVLCHLKASQNLRQAIVVITDGVDQHSRLSLEQLIELVRSSRAQLFMIESNIKQEYNFGGHPEAKLTLVSGHDIDNPAVVFDRLTKEAGAESFFPSSEDGLEQALKKVSDLLDAQYTIAYYPQDSLKKFRRIQVKLRRSGLVVTVRHSVGSEIATGAPGDFTAGTCDVSPKVHPYPYESRVTQSKGETSYHEDFSDVRSGWPNHENSRYIADGYELSNAGPSKVETLPGSDQGPIPGGFSFSFDQNVVAAYGPWWTDFHASAFLDEVFSKRSGFPLAADPNSIEADQATAGVVFRLNNEGYYALLLANGRGARDPSYKVEKWEYLGNAKTDLIPWTVAHLSEVPSSGIPIAVDCVGSQITVSINGQQVGHVKDDSYDKGYVGFVLSGMGHARFHDLLVTQQ